MLLNSFNLPIKKDLTNLLSFVLKQSVFLIKKEKTKVKEILLFAALIMSISLLFAQDYVLEWQGPGGFDCTFQDDFFSTPSTFDMNDDGNPEVVMKNYDGENTTIRVYDPCSNYDLIWTHQIPGPAWIPGFGNITGTITDEMIYVIEGDTLNYYDNVYIINITTYESFHLAEGSKAIIVYDIDGDGKDEVLIKLENSSLEIWGDGTTIAECKTVQPHKSRLSQNYPNPFNPYTTINYQLEKSGLIELKIYNIKGQLVETLLKQYQNTGDHSVIWEAKGVSSGMYFYQISVDGQLVETKKAICVK